MKTLKPLAIILIMVLSASFAKAQNNINNITKAYFGVKNSLAVGNAADASNKSKDLLLALSAPETGLTPDQQKTYNIYADKLKFDSRHILEVSAIDHQREHFANLSKNLYALLKVLKVNTSPLYYQYCPMKKAYWLSETAAVKNPYYNDKMMATCGSTKETLAAAK